MGSDGLPARKRLDISPETLLSYSWNYCGRKKRWLVSKSFNPGVNKGTQGVAFHVRHGKGRCAKRCGEHAKLMRSTYGGDAKRTHKIINKTGSSRSLSTRSPTASFQLSNKALCRRRAINKRFKQEMMQARAINADPVARAPYEASARRQEREVFRVIMPACARNNGQEL